MDLQSKKKRVVVLVLVLVWVGGVVGLNNSSDYYEEDLELDSHPPNVLVLRADNNNNTQPLAHTPNTDILLHTNLSKVHLFCSAYYPVVWTYRGQGFPFLNVDNTRFVEDFYDPTSYAFSALLELDGLVESQTGNYTCQKWNDETLASSFYIYIPVNQRQDETTDVAQFVAINNDWTVHLSVKNGDDFQGDKILLLEKNSSVSVNLNSTEIDVPCSVSDPQANVTLKKLLPKGKDVSDWSPVAKSLYTFSPKRGFTFSGEETPTGIGSFLCSTETGQSALVNIQVLNQFAEEGSEDEDNLCCDKKFLRGLGDERTSCRGYISHACQLPQYLNRETSPCADWKIADFLRNPVELCKQEISPQGASTGVGFYKAEDHGGHHLYVYCQADPKEFTQGFKIALQFLNGSVLFVDDERQKVPAVSEFPSGYEVNAEITDILFGYSEGLSIHCYIPLKFSFKWIKISKDVPSAELQFMDDNYVEPPNNIRKSNSNTILGNFNILLFTILCSFINT